MSPEHDLDQAWLTACQIADGHAWRLHREEFPATTDQASFAELILDIMLNPDAERSLERNRRAFWREESGTIVIVSPKDPDGGTAFVPQPGRTYFESIE